MLSAGAEAGERPAGGGGDGIAGRVQAGVAQRGGRPGAGTEPPVERDHERDGGEVVDEHDAGDEGGGAELEE
jgi:hypothetical protein